MTELTLEDKVAYGKKSRTQQIAEEHFFDEAQPFFPKGFSVGYRNPGHWDVYANSVPGKASAWRYAHPGGFTTEQDGGRERAFVIRGEPGDVSVYDHRWDPHRPHPRDSMEFRSVMCAMLWIMEELMQEDPKEIL